MRPILTLPALLLAAACAAPPASTDVERIGAVVDDWNRAWKVEDPVLAASGYSDDAEFTNAFGFHRIGRAEIEAYLTEVFALDFVMAGDSTEVRRELEFVRPDVALVHSRVERVGQRVGSGEELAPRRTSHLRVFAKDRGTWRIVSHLVSDARETSRPDH